MSRELAKLSDEEWLALYPGVACNGCGVEIYRAFDGKCNSCHNLEIMAALDPREARTPPDYQALSLQEKLDLEVQYQQLLEFQRRYGDLKGLDRVRRYLDCG